MLSPYLFSCLQADARGLEEWGPCSTTFCQVPECSEHHGKSTAGPTHSHPAERYHGKSTAGPTHSHPAERYHGKSTAGPTHILLRDITGKSTAGPTHSHPAERYHV